MNKLFLLMNCWVFIAISACTNTSRSKINYNQDKNLADSVSMLYKQGKYFDVISLTTNLINKKDQNPLYRMLRAFSYAKVVKNDKSIEDLSYVIMFVPDTIRTEFDGENHYCLRWALRNRGVVLAKIGKYEEAIADYNHLLQLTRNAPAISELGTVYLQMGNVRTGDSLMAVAYNMDSSITFVTANVGIAAVQDSNWERAIVYLNKALSKGEDADYLLNRGVAYWYEKKYVLAEKDLKRAIDIDPNYVEPYVFYGKILRIQGRKQEFCEMLHKAIALGKKVDPKLLEECQ